MKISDVKVIGNPRVLATAADVAKLEARLWITFPKGYRDYITRLGEGTLGGSFVRIYPPWRIEKELTDWRRRINKYWLWDKGRALLPKERALECVIIGDTVNGDELVFHPTRPNRLFVLPRESEKVFEAGSDLLAAVEWMCASGKLAEPFDERNFEPFDSRTKAEAHEEPPSPTDPEGESIEEIMELARAWAKRHKTREEARKDLREHAGQRGKPQLLYEGILIDGKETGYGIAWHILGKKSGRIVGLFRSYEGGCSYESVG